MIICDNDSMRDCAPRLIFVSAATGAREVEAVTLILFLMARLVLICPMVFLNYDIYLLLISCGVIGLIHYLRFVKSPSLIFFSKCQVLLLHTSSHSERSSITLSLLFESDILKMAWN